MQFSTPNGVISLILCALEMQHLCHLIMYKRIKDIQNMRMVDNVLFSTFQAATIFF